MYKGMNKMNKQGMMKNYDNLPKYEKIVKTGQTKKKDMSQATRKEK